MMQFKSIFLYGVLISFLMLLYIMGNHEHYNYDFKYTIARYQRRVEDLPNIQVLDKEAWTLHDEVTFIGGTLWTDMNNEDSLTMWHVGRV
jgi:hypothetical protein